VLLFDSSASLSLAYNELSIESKKRDEKMKNMDPKKQQQMERLGMATGNLRQVVPDTPLPHCVYVLLMAPSTNIKVRFFHSKLISR